MEASEQNSLFQLAEEASTSVIQDNIHEDARDNNYFSGKDYSQTTFSPNSDTNENMHVAEFQRAVDRLKLRRQSSTSGPGPQVQEGSHTNSVVRDLLQGQRYRTSAEFSSTCTSPLSSNGAIFN